jgi:hypothetical protein
MTRLDRFSLRLAMALAAATTWTAPAAAQYGPATVSVLTQRNDYDRTSHNPRETVLTPDAVRRSFGKLFELPVDGQVYAQPLVVGGVQGYGATKNLLIVATASNTVYFFDADNGQELWSRNFGAPVPTQTLMWPAPGRVYRDMSPVTGITSTPVVDAATNTLYFITYVATPPGSLNPVRKHWVHALDLTTRAEKFGAPVEVRYPAGDPDLVALQRRGVAFPPHQGHGDPNVLHFAPYLQLQRPGLVLVNGRLLAGFGSLGDNGQYQGWIFSFDAGALRSPAQVWVSTLSGTENAWGGIWQSGVGLTADERGNVYFTTGNGSFNNSNDFADSFIKLAVGADGSLRKVDSFTPCNQEELQAQDLDLTSGVLRLPGQPYLIGGGKQGTLYVMRADSMGGYVNGGDDCWATGTDRVKQVVVASCGPEGDTRHNHGAPVFWVSDTRGPMLYVWPENDVLRAFTWADSTVTPDNCADQPDWAMSSARSPARLYAGMTGGMLSISSNNGRGGIVWAATPVNNNANQQVVPGVLRAYDADDLRRQLWSSCPTDDCTTRGPNDPGSYAKFTPPTVANGKVYLASLSRRVNVYGLNPPSPPAPAANLLVNGHFEQGTAGWTLPDTGAFVDSMYPYDGDGAAHLVPGYSIPTRVQQQVTAPASGRYRLSALCLSSVLAEFLADSTGPPARLGVDVNGATVGRSDASNYAGYLPCTIDFAANRGDTITVWYDALPIASGYPSKWGSVTWSFLDVVELNQLPPAGQGRSGRGR